MTDGKCEEIKKLWDSTIEPFSARVVVVLWFTRVLKVSTIFTQKKTAF